MEGGFFECGGSEMIFVTVGTHPAQFDRLLKELDSLAEQGKIKEEVFAQVGHTNYVPKSKLIKTMDFIGLDEFKRKIREASLVITHGGEGSIGEALQQETPMVIVPRLKKFGEHTNDHQLELTRAIEEENAAIAVVAISELGKAIENAKKMKKRKTEHGRGIMKEIEDFVRSEKLA